MKNNKLIFCVGIAFGLIACNSIAESPVVVAKHQMEVSATAEQELTRTSISYEDVAGGYVPQWTSGDKIGIYTIVGTTENNTAKPFSIASIEDGKASNFTGTVDNTGAGEYRFFAYYPYNNTINQSVNSHCAVECVLPSIQKPSKTSFDGAADVLIAGSTTKTITAEQESVNDLNFRFARVVSVVKLNLNNLDSSLASDIIKKVRISSQDYVLSGNYTLNLETMTTSDWNGNDYVEAQYTDAGLVAGSSFTSWIVVNPIVLDAGKTVTVKVVTDNSTLVKNITVPSGGINFVEGAIVTLNVNMSGTQMNATPTTPHGMAMLKMPLVTDADGFNMLTDGGFERNASATDFAQWKTTSLWYFPDWVGFASTAYAGNRTLHVDMNSRDWRDAMIQTVSLCKNTSYTLSADIKTAWNNANVYMGFRAATTHDKNTIWDGGSAWTNYSYTWVNETDVQANAFFGGFPNYNFWIEIDNVKVCPTGYSRPCYMPSGTTLYSGAVKNATHNILSACEQIVVWPIGNSLSTTLYGAALSKPTIDGVAHTNAFALATVSAEEGTLTITKFLGNGTDILSATDSETAVVPTAGISSSDGNTLYVSCYGAATGYPATQDDWTASAGYMLKSIDGGKSWSKMNGLTRNAGSNFIKLSMWIDSDNYVYVFGTGAGRAGVTTYVARVLLSEFEDAAQWRYWNGGEWVADESAATSIFYGPTSEMTVFKSAKTGNYTALFRSRTTGALVYREAQSPVGPWSGEKIAASDPTGGKYYAPSVVVLPTNSSSDKPLFVVVSQIDDGYAGGGEL